MTSEWLDGKPVSVTEEPLITAMADLLEWHLKVIGNPSTLKDLLESVNEDVDDKADYIRAGAARKALQRDDRFLVSGKKGSHDSKWGLVPGAREEAVPGMEKGEKPSHEEF